MRMCKSLYDKICQYLENNNNISLNKIELPRLRRYPGIDYTFYEGYKNRIEIMNLNKLQNSQRKKLSEILDSENWGIQLENYFLELSHVDNQDLFKYLSIDKLSSRIKERNQLRIKHFISALENGYSSANYYQF